MGEVKMQRTYGGKKKEEQKRTSDHTGRAKIWATWVGGWTLRRGEGEEWKKSREETN